MRINPTGFANREQRIVAIVMDEIFMGVWDMLEPRHPLSVWAYAHDDGTFTVHWSYKDVSDAGAPPEPLVLEPMIAFANSKPYVTKIVSAIQGSGIE